MADEIIVGDASVIASAASLCFKSFVCNFGSPGACCIVKTARVSPTKKDVNTVDSHFTPPF